jgi:hypothetical protein
MDYFYDGQIRRYVTQFMRIFIGFKYKTGGDAPEERHVPVMYGDMTRQVAAIIKENSENKLLSVPKIACYITGLSMDTSRLSDPTFVSKINIRERRYTDVGGAIEYQNIQGGNYTVERLLPTPFTLSVKADIWTSNTDQKLQLLEQILVLFNPSLEIQTTDNYIDWTSLSVIYLKNINMSSRTIPQGPETEIDICSLDFELPIYISPPTKVKKLGIVKSIIANVFTEQGDILDLENLIYNDSYDERLAGKFRILQQIQDRLRVLMFKANNDQPYDYEVTLVDATQVILSLGLLLKEVKQGLEIDWNTILEVQGAYRPDVDRIYFKQPSGFEMVGTFTINPLDPSKLIVTIDRDTIPTNTLISSSIDGLEARGTIDAIIDPYTYNPVTSYGSKEDIPVGVRFLMLDDVNPNNVNLDGPDAWKSMGGEDPEIIANSIIEWNGNEWVEIWNPSTGTNPTYVQNLRTGIQYRWIGDQWLKSFEGEYAPGYWGFLF